MLCKLRYCNSHLETGVCQWGAPNWGAENVFLWILQAIKEVFNKSHYGNSHLQIIQKPPLPFQSILGTIKLTFTIPRFLSAGRQNTFADFYWIDSITDGICVEGIIKLKKRVSGQKKIHPLLQRLIDKKWSKIWLLIKNLH